MKIERHIASSGYDRIRCWVNPVALPLGEEVLVLSQKLLIRAFDCFSDVSLFRSRDGGATWSAPEAVPALADFAAPEGGRHAFLVSAMRRVAADRVLVLVTTFRYDRENRLDPASPQRVRYLYFRPSTGEWSESRELELAADAADDVLAVDAQFVDAADGELLLPYTVRRRVGSRLYSRIARVRPEADGRLTVVDLSEPVVLEEGRGFLEPSLCRYGERYYLSLRNDRSGYVTASGDWKKFPAARPWCRVDGSSLGNYNTMTRLLAFGGKLHLVYTRKGLNNDHVFRHRAPLLIAEVDPERLAVLPETETVVVPEHGARLGNFTAVVRDPHHAYVSVAEWMQTLEPDHWNCRECEKYGAQNRIWYVTLES